MAEGNFASVSSVEEFIIEQEDKNNPHEKGIISTYEINTLLHGKCSIRFLHSLFESESSPVPFPILHLNLRIKIVRVHFG